MRRKHRNDQNHGKNGWHGGNPRYRRSQAARVLEGDRPKDYASPRKQITMGKN